MECKAIKNQLSDYIDGQLSEAAAGYVAHHLESCPDCKQAYEEMTRLVGFMREIDTVDEPADLLQNVRSRLESKPSLWDRMREWFSAPALRVPAAATILAAILLLVLYVPGERELIPVATAPDIHLKGAEGMLDLTVTLEQEKKAPERQKLDDEVKELVEVAGETEPVAVRGGRGEEVAVRVIEGDELKRERSNGEVPPAAPKSEASDELRSQDAPAPAPAEDASEVASKPVVTMDKDAASGLAAPKKSAVTVVEMSSEQLFVVAAVDSAGGEIVEWVYDDEHRLSAVVAEIPADRYDAFQKMLGQLGQVSSEKMPLSATKEKSAADEDPNADKKSVTVRVRIRR